MKKIIPIIILIFKEAISYSQIAIGSGGNAPHQFAQLDIISYDKGVLLPRVALVSTTSSMPIDSNPSTIPNSLLVYNTVTQDNLKSGYYFWLDNQWNKIATKSGWNTSLTSNNGIIRNNNSFELGGKLIDPVTINTNGQSMEIKGTTANAFSVDNGTSTILSVDVANNRVGIGTSNPAATLDIQGTIATKEDTLILSDDANSVNIPAISGQVAINGGSKDFTITPPESPIVAGQRLIIYNNTDYNGTFGDTTIHSKQAIEFIYSDLNWRSTFPINHVSKMHMSKVIIPPHPENNNLSSNGEDKSKYDSNDWEYIGIEKATESKGKENEKEEFEITFAKMNIIYRHKKTLFRPDAHPVLSVRAKPANSNTDTGYKINNFVANFVRLEIITEEKSRKKKSQLTVSITKIDKIGPESAHWEDPFTLDIIIVIP